jgi:hypothetical protein
MDETQMIVPFFPPRRPEVTGKEFVWTNEDPRVLKEIIRVSGRLPDLCFLKTEMSV